MGDPNLAGRRLWLPEINSRNRQRQQAAERAAINAPLQGTAADIIKRAMIDVDDWIQAENVPANLVMQVHDELVLEVKNDALEDVRKGVVELMSTAAELSIELLVEAESGPDWGQRPLRTRLNLTRFHGVFAPNSPDRARITPGHRPTNQPHPA